MFGRAVLTGIKAMKNKQAAYGSHAEVRIPQSEIVCFASKCGPRVRSKQFPSLRYASVGTTAD